MLQHEPCTVKEWGYFIALNIEVHPLDMEHAVKIEYGVLSFK